MMTKSSITLAIVGLAFSAVNGFVPSQAAFTRTVAPSTTLNMAPKGFGPKKEKKQKSEGQVDREKKSSKYDEISSGGGQEYNIFVRQFGSDDTTWLPSGSIAVPRGAQVADAIFANEEGIKVSISRTYPKLKGYEAEMEFGFNLKIYPDDPIEVAVKGGAKSSGPSVGNWISTLLSPVDASAVPPPKIEE